MKKIVVLTGSPRKDGNSNHMAEAFIDAALQNKIEIVRFDSYALKIQACNGCKHCYSGEEACIYDDDFNLVASEIATADGILLVSPLYWYTFPAALKLIIDKFIAFHTAKLDFSGKKSALISCCADPGLETFSGLHFSYLKTIKLLGIESLGEVLIDNLHEVGDVDKSDGLSLAAQLAKKFK